jgi:hypothetical protein
MSTSDGPAFDATRPRIETAIPVHLLSMTTRSSPNARMSVARPPRTRVQRPMDSPLPARTVPAGDPRRANGLAWGGWPPTACWEFLPERAQPAPGARSGPCPGRSGDRRHVSQRFAAGTFRLDRPVPRRSWRMTLENPARARKKVSHLGDSHITPRSPEEVELPHQIDWPLAEGLVGDVDAVRRLGVPDVAEFHARILSRAEHGGNRKGPSVRR